MYNELLKYLYILIGYKSVSPESNGAMEYIHDLLLQSGFTSEIKIFGDSPENLTTNLYAVYGQGKPNICFAGHVDVVPPGNAALWQNDPFSAIKSINSDGQAIVYGRGTVDMKGAIACMLAAAMEFIKNNPNLSGAISFLLTSDEEGDANYGTKKMLEYIQGNQSQPDLVILGEPTNMRHIGDTIKIGRRGSMNFTLHVQGIQGHVAYPDKAVNPNHLATQIMYELINHQFDQGTEYFQDSNLEITSIDVDNNSTNVIPAQTTIKFNVRFNNLHTSDSITGTIIKLVNKYTTNYVLTSKVSAESFIQKPQAIIQEFAQIVKRVTNIDCHFSTSGGTSDARFIHKYYPVVEFGLLSDMAHKIDEYTEISNLQKLYNVYYDSLKHFLEK